MASRTRDQVHGFPFLIRHHAILSIVSILSISEFPLLTANDPKSNLRIEFAS